MDENKQPTLPPSYQERCNLFNQELDALMKKYHLSLQGDLEFPQYRILPNDLQLALLLLEQHQGKYMFRLQDTMLEDMKKQEPVPAEGSTPNANQG